MIAATGVRISWTDLPPTLRAAIEHKLGAPVSAVTPQAGGFSPGTADRIRTATGDRAFVKAVGTGINPRSVELARAEARNTARLPAGLPAPRLLATVEVTDSGDNWIALIMEDVDGRHPRTPWQPAELRAAATTLDRFAAEPALAGLPSAADTLGADLVGWESLAADPPADLDPWAGARLPQLCATAERARRSLAGDTLCHCDVRADNMLIRPDGSLVVVDWPWAAAGPPWLDRALLAVNVLAHGGDPGDVLAGVDRDVVRDLFAALAGFFLHMARQPGPPGLPTLRAFQRAQAEALLPWLRAQAG
ncbi:phosphotransferase family protein [Mangrovihabitans endophyticus]|uniref:Aminoglycoside phosphotransferase domain-containing protein n=1 Tax=Mangrovihabitans endophyticus TaxID=1751298 RepID=A0A8J3C0S8_9ACTN|nr:aminoglycoside phosphotransferase family protein [Mangrovihabitans endophyticus]GGL02485.1 hypothetical protein GCM10012284_41270 [Mangrovihabitans endophyticus]